ncbi:hypothetical protein NA56DRAFT_168492 [Hyaloscypha hepaticicola]|uniref:Uncharacterized protein n=1 Tax=Hyaloscypha hepaticicola TaxID=2082293 RepID=A0A2J6Q2W4_9HELO|nr:hypothetical protein NA56DRAFT_168492 [Hyaloscypha hepaticicola]
MVSSIRANIPAAILISQTSQAASVPCNTKQCGERARLSWRSILSSSLSSRVYGRGFRVIYYQCQLKDKLFCIQLAKKLQKYFFKPPPIPSIFKRIRASSLK